MNLYLKLMVVVRVEVEISEGTPVVKERERLFVCHQHFLTNTKAEMVDEALEKELKLRGKL